MPECRDCINLGTLLNRRHLKGIATCDLGLWNPTETPQWYSLATVKANRPPVKDLGATCQEFAPRPKNKN